MLRCIRTPACFLQLAMHSLVYCSRSPCSRRCRCTWQSQCPGRLGLVQPQHGRQRFEHERSIEHPSEDADASRAHPHSLIDTGLRQLQVTFSFTAFVARQQCHSASGARPRRHIAQQLSDLRACCPPSGSVVLSRCWSRWVPGLGARRVSLYSVAWAIADRRRPSSPYTV